MTDTADLTETAVAAALDIDELRKRLPAGPWTMFRWSKNVWHIEQDSADGTHIARVDREPVARAIAALPSLFVALERLAWDNERLDNIATGAKVIADSLISENERLRARIAELEAACDEYKQAAEVEARLRREFKELSGQLLAAREATAVELNRLLELVQTREAERDAVSAAICDRCDRASDAAFEIRALNQPEGEP